MMKKYYLPNGSQVVFRDNNFDTEKFNYYIHCLLWCDDWEHIGKANDMKKE